MIRDLLYKILLCVWVVISVNGVAYSQDMIYTQYQVSPMMINPAMTGFMLGKYRISAQYRNQWGSINSKYETFSASADINFMKCKWKKDYFGFGVYFMRDKAGDLGLYTQNTYFSFAYSKGWGTRNKQEIAIGVQGGIIQRGINLNNAIYPDGIDESQPASFTTGDVNAGILWHGQLGRIVNMYAAFSVNHLMNPRKEIIADTGRYQYLYSANTSAQVELYERWRLLPSIAFFMQSNSYQVYPSVAIQYALGEDIFSEYAVSAGIGYRYVRNEAGDALIPYVRGDIRNFLIGISYDVTISGLREPTQGRGSFEVSLSYLGSLACQKNKGLLCPKF